MQSRFDTRGLFFAGAISDPAALTAMSATGGQRSSLDPGSLDSQLIAKAGNAKEDRHALIQAWGRPLVDAVLDELAASAMHDRLLGCVLPSEPFLEEAHRTSQRSCVGLPHQNFFGLALF